MTNLHMVSADGYRMQDVDAITIGISDDTQ